MVPVAPAVWHSTAAHDDAVRRRGSTSCSNRASRGSAVCSRATSSPAPTRTRGDTNERSVRERSTRPRRRPPPRGCEDAGDGLFPFLDDAVANDERVVVHCLAGIGRTGHVLAAWLVHGRDYDPVDAIETVEEMGRSPAAAEEAGNARRGELYELLAHFA